MTNVNLQLQGLSGKLYPFAMTDLPTTAPRNCGVYVFARRTTDFKYELLYIGKASHFSDRVNDSHEKVPAAMRRGMSTLGLMSCANDSEALIAERDLIANYNPPLNKSHRTG